MVASDSAPRSFRRARPLLGTLVEITVVADAAHDEADVHAAIDGAFAEIATVHRLMSFHEAGSDIDRINHAVAGSVVTVDTRTAEVLAAALAFAAASDNAFDCTVAPLLVRNGTLPSPAALDPADADTGADTADAAFRVKNSHVTKLRPCLVDLGGIAKGYAVDRALLMLRSHGFAHVLVNAGGDIRHAGRAAVPVQLRNPLDPAAVATTVPLYNRALASSAVYGATHDTAQASALIDARRATPLCRDGGVSILAPDCMTADALTKVVLVSGNARHPLLAQCGAEVALFLCST